MTAASALAGRRVVVTRAAGQSSGLTSLLRARGAVPVEVPLVEIEAVDDGMAALRAVDVGAHEWLVLTSPNAVEAFFAVQSAVPSSIAVVGTATAAALAAHGVAATLVPAQQRGSALAAALAASGPPSTALVVQSAEAAPDLVDGLRAAGWTVVAVAAHRAVPVRPSAAAQLKALSADAVLFASGSAARAWADAFGAVVPAVVVAIGPQCADEARGAGLPVTAVAEHSSIEGLVDTLERVLEGR